MNERGIGFHRTIAGSGNFLCSWIEKFRIYMQIFKTKYIPVINGILIEYFSHHFAVFSKGISACPNFQTQFIREVKCLVIAAVNKQTGLPGGVPGFVVDRPAFVVG